MKTGVFGSIFISIALAIGLFHWKHKVIKMEDALAEIIRSIEEEKTNIHILTAEWGHLINPIYLQKMATKFLLGWSNVSPKQIVKLEAVGFRSKEVLMPDDSYLTQLTRIGSSEDSVE
jgi:hypothetical protein